MMHDGSVAVQDFVFDVRFLYQMVEAVAQCSMFVLPLFSSCLLGWLGAKLVRSRLASNDASPDSRPAMKFTLRGLLIAMVVIAGLTTWLSSHVSQWQLREQQKHAAFIDFFKGSFTSGQVELLQEPQLIGKSGHGDHYRITAPIGRDGKESWAIWTYWADGSFIHTFGYAEASTEDALAIPINEYLPGYSAVIDGVPDDKTYLKIVEAEVIEAPTENRGAIIEVVAETEFGRECDLSIQPFNAVKTVPKMQMAVESEIVSWEVELARTYRGAKIEFEVSSRVNPIYRATKTSGEIALREATTIAAE